MYTVSSALHVRKIEPRNKEEERMKNFFRCFHLIQFFYKKKSWSLYFFLRWERSGRLILFSLSIAFYAIFGCRTFLTHTSVCVFLRNKKIFYLLFDMRASSRLWDWSCFLFQCAVHLAEWGFNRWVDRVIT